MRIVLIAFILVLATGAYAQTATELNQQAIELNKNGKSKEAIANLKKSIKKDPQKKETYIIYGGILVGNKDYKQAEENFKKAIELDSTYVEAYDFLSATSFLIKDLKTGIKYLSKAIELEPTASRFQARADLRGMIGDYDGQ